MPSDVKHKKNAVLCIEAISGEETPQTYTWTVGISVKHKKGYEGSFFRQYGTFQSQFWLYCA
jgi:hypothetical protein